MGNSRKYRLHNAKSGAAIGVRITTLATRNAIAEILDDGTIKINLATSGSDKEINHELLKFLSKILETQMDKLDIVAGESGKDKLVTILNLDADTVQRRIVQALK